jgi:hypothetical protein
MSRVQRTVLIFVILISFSFSLLTSAFALEWPQDAGNPQRTGSTDENPLEPWTFLWSWNGPDANGGIGNHFYDAPKEARTVTGGNNIYVPTGSQGLYALNKNTGAQSWRIPVTSFNAAPIYDSGFVYAGGTNGTLYKINASTGQITGSYAANSPLNKAILIVGSYVYAASDDGKLHKVNTTTMASVWVYTGSSTAATPASYSLSRDILVYATDDLYVHAVNNSDGSSKWKVKPTPNNPGDSSVSVNTTVAGTPVGTQFEHAYPVIAEQHGIALIRLQLPPSFMFDNGLPGGTYPNSNTEVKTYLQNNPSHKNLFALNLDNGSEKFIPAVGYGSTEDMISTRPEGYGVMGSQPVVKVWPNGSEVVYIHFRNGQSNPPDGRWDGHMGEMVLDNTTVSGLIAGDLRFMKTSRYNGYGGSGYDHIIDEQTPITVAGDTIFNSHWAAMTSHRIIDRSSTFGLTYSNPITTTKHPPIIRALSNTCTNKNTSTHWTTCTNLNYVTDGGRYFDGPGWWGYWGVADPPGWKIGSGNTTGTSYSTGFLPRYTYVADGKIIVEGNGGELLVFSHSGSVLLSPTPTIIASTPTPTTQQPSPTPKPGDVNGDLSINLSDLSILLSNFGKTGAVRTQGDLDGNGSVNLSDLSQLLANFGQ